jgi:uncharacterized protein YecT (DUF1311 family)
MRVFPQRAALFVLLLIPVMQVQAQTQGDMNAQARADFARADAELNKTYQSVLAKLPAAESKQKLREAQRAWIASRDAEAVRAAKEAEGGSMAPTLRYETMTDLTRQRIKELEAMLKGAAPNKKSTSTPEPSVSSAPAASPAPPKESEGEQTKSVSKTTEPAAESSATSISPDKKWRYTGGNTHKLVEAATNEVALEFSCSLGEHNFPAPLWAPDSKRFALSCSGGKGDETSVYQLRDNRWAEPDEALGNGDEILEQAGKILDTQAKKKGLRKGTFLHMNWWTVEADHWIDPNTLVVYASMLETVHRSNGEFVGPSFGTDLLFTLKFDDAGKWKIVKTHQMSEKEVEKHKKEQ